MDDEKKRGFRRQEQEIPAWALCPLRDYPLSSLRLTSQAARPGLRRQLHHQRCPRRQHSNRWSHHQCGDADGLSIANMYRTGDPRFRRRLDQVGTILESANESAQNNIYDFAQLYVKPCFESIGECLTTCVDASCPTLNLSARDRERARRQHGRRRGRMEASFDFYDDWEEEEDMLGSWTANDEFDRLLSSNQGYGTVQNAQPGRPRGMSYPKGRRKSLHDGEPDPTVIPGSSNFISRLFGRKGKNLQYKPSAADLQEHPGARRLGRDLTEGEALLAHCVGPSCFRLLEHNFFCVCILAFFCLPSLASGREALYLYSSGR